MLGRGEAQVSLLQVQVCVRHPKGIVADLRPCLSAACDVPRINIPTVTAKTRDGTECYIFISVCPAHSGLELARFKR